MHSPRLSRLISLISLLALTLEVKAQPSPVQSVSAADTSVVVTPNAGSVTISVNGTTILNPTFAGKGTNTMLFGTPVNSLLNPDSLGWAWTNTTGQRQFVIINLNGTPTASLQACFDVFWTNSAGVVSNRWASSVGVAAQSTSFVGILESNGAVQILTNRLNGATTVLTLVQSSATPLP